MSQVLDRPKIEELISRLAALKPREELAKRKADEAATELREIQIHRAQIHIDIRSEQLLPAIGKIDGVLVNGQYRATLIGVDCGSALIVNREAIRRKVPVLSVQPVAV